MHQHLAVGFRLEFVAALLQLFFQGLVVLDDTVVDDEDFPPAVRVGVGICLGWLAVGCPAGMSDAGIALPLGISQPIFQNLNLARRPPA